jgi:hypothetical protein
MPIPLKYKGTKNASFPKRKHFNFKDGNESGMTSY